MTQSHMLIKVSEWPAFRCGKLIEICQSLMDGVVWNDRLAPGDYKLVLVWSATPYTVLV